MIAEKLTKTETKMNFITKISLVVCLTSQLAVNLANSAELNGLLSLTSSVGTLCLANCRQRM